jgi:hypothetical protein
MKNVRSLRLHARLPMAAAFLALLLFGLAVPMSPKSPNLVHAAGTLTVSAGGPYSGTVGVAVTMTASVNSATTSPSYTWSFGDGSPAGYGQTVSHTYGAATTYTITVTVNDLATGGYGSATTNANITGSSAGYETCYTSSGVPEQIPSSETCAQVGLLSYSPTSSGYQTCYTSSGVAEEIPSSETCAQAGLLSYSSTSGYQTCYTSSGVAEEIPSSETCAQAGDRKSVV